MTFTKCPACGVLFHITTNSDTANFRKPCCDRCKVNGRLSRLRWEAPRSNNYDKTRR